MAVLGLCQLTRPELWRDELTGWALASRTIPELLATARQINGSQLPYYVFMHYWMTVFGSSALAMRSVSVLAMIGAAAFVTLAARDLAGTRAGVAAGLLFAVIPSVSRFAQEARFYAPAVFFAALATWLLVRALNRPSWALWAGYTAAMAAMGYLDTVAMALLPGHAAWVALRWWRERNRRTAAGFIAAAVATAAISAPIVIVGAQQATSQVLWVPKPSASPAALSQFGANLFYSGPVAAAMIVLAALAWAARPRLAGYLTAAALVPLAAVIAVSEGSVSYFFPRYVLFTLIALSISAGVAVTRLGRLPAAAAIAAVALLGLHDQVMIRQPSAHNWSNYPVGVVTSTLRYNDAAQVIGARARPGDGMAFPEHFPYRSRQVNLGIGYYLGRYLRPGVPAPRVLLTTRSAIQTDFLYPAPCTRPSRCLRSAPRRVWLVGSAGPYTPDALRVFLPSEASALRHDYRVSRIWHVGDLAIDLLIRR